jgi:hypothetical protein
MLPLHLAHDPNKLGIVENLRNESSSSGLGSSSSPGIMFSL